MIRHKLSDIIEALNKNNINKPCPRCESISFSVVGQSEIPLVKPIATQDPIATLTELSPAPVKSTMPVIVVVCDNCGFVSQYAEASLGLLSPKLGFQ